MAASAAAAGYTLAAALRADAIRTDSNGLTAGDAKVKVTDGEMPVYAPALPVRRIRRWFWLPRRSSGCTNTSGTSLAGWASSRCGRTRLLFAPEDLTRSATSAAFADR
jgi:hypothetical protein